MQKFKRKKPTI